jgi:hypothetical protein
MEFGAGVACTRHRVEECLEDAKTYQGMSQYGYYFPSRQPEASAVSAVWPL